MSPEIRFAYAAADLACSDGQLDVDGMNKVALAEGNVDRQFSLEEATGTITLQVKRLWSAALV